MNKKIILLLVITCILSAIAIKTFAGTAGGSGSCGLIASPATITSTVGTPVSVQYNGSALNLTRTQLTVTVICNSTIPCINITNTSTSVCNDSTSTKIDSATTEYLAQQFNATNATFVQVRTGSVYMIWLERLAGPDAVRIVSAQDDGTFVKLNKFVMADGREITDIGAYYDSARSELVVDLATNTGAAVGLTTLGWDSNLDLKWNHGANVDATTTDLDIVDMKPFTTNEGHVTILIYSTSIGVTLAVGSAVTGSQQQIVTANKYSKSGIPKILVVFTAGYIPSPTSPITQTTSIYGSTYNFGSGIIWVSASDDGLSGHTEIIPAYDDGVQTSAPIFSIDGVRLTFAPTPPGKQSVTVTGVETGSSNNYLITGKTKEIGIHNIASPSDFSYSVYTNLLVDGVPPRVAGPDEATTRSDMGMCYRASDGKNKFAAMTTAGGLAGNTVFSTGSTILSGLTTKHVSSGEVVTCVPEAKNPTIFKWYTSTGSVVAAMLGSSAISAYTLNMSVDSIDFITIQNNNGGNTGDYMTYVLGGRALDNQSVYLDYLNTSLALSAINPNGTMQFNTQRNIEIETMSPDINILNFQLRWQNFTGSFDTTKGTCIGCIFDAAGICQAEIERISGMFTSYNVTINLTPDRNMNMQDLQMCCRDLNRTIALGPAGAGNCTSLTTYPPSTYSSTGCFTPTNVTPYSYNTSDTVCVYLNNLTTGGVQIPIGVMAPTTTCGQLACEINGTWNASNDQTFTINKTITITAN